MNRCAISSSVMPGQAHCARAVMPSASVLNRREAEERLMSTSSGVPGNQWAPPAQSNTWNTGQKTPHPTEFHHPISYIIHRIQYVQTNRSIGPQCRLLGRREPGRHRRAPPSRGWPSCVVIIVYANKTSEHMSRWAPERRATRERQQACYHRKVHLSMSVRGNPSVFAHVGFPAKIMIYFIVILLIWSVFTSGPQTGSQESVRSDGTRALGRRHGVRLRIV